MNISDKSRNTILWLWYLLKYTYGLFLIVVGTDKFFDIIVHWAQYVHPSVLPFMSMATVLLSVAILEIILGLLILSPWIKVGCYATIVWMAVIIIDLLALGLIDIAARDVLITIGILVLAWLTDVKEELT